MSISGRGLRYWHNVNKKNGFKGTMIVCKNGFIPSSVFKALWKINRHAVQTCLPSLKKSDEARISTFQDVNAQTWLFRKGGFEG